LKKPLFEPVFAVVRVYFWTYTPIWRIIVYKCSNGPIHGEFRVEMQACKKKGVVVMGELGAYIEAGTHTTAHAHDSAHTTH